MNESRRTNDNVKRSSCAAVVLAALGLSLGCGAGGGAAGNDCEKLVDAYATSWQRCMRSSYADAQKTWSDALQCDKAKASNSSQVNACISALDALDCTSVNSGTSPAQCMNALSQ
ncbi:MAG TPA: hypothetical protein VHC69_05535 [Polyangiaceae bacterium]|nr:hypothetical protein [Polyangiaceae bacterium]